MLNFKNTEIEDIKIFEKYIFINEELSCENAFVNMLVWQNAYNNMWAEYEGQLIIKSGKEGNASYRLPIGGDLSLGIELIRQYSGEEYPKFWIPDGEAFKRFTELYGEDYIIEEVRDAFDYIYLREDLATLAGKKYHSKRNHISAFSKRYEWEYKAITPQNIDDVKLCAEKWYNENSDRLDKYMLAEKQGLETILNNMEVLRVRGGAIYINGGVVAFTLGSPINNETFDIHIEKALKDYAEAYTVINREFAKTLESYKYINREDDMGLEGLRKAKLSYKPHILLKKYACRKNKIIEECREIYKEAFCDTDNSFENKLFSLCSDYLRVLKVEDKVVSMLFALPCKITDGESFKEGYYIFAAATLDSEQGKGYMTKLLEQVNLENKLLFLKPANEELIEFYKRVGFSCFTATKALNKKCKAEPQAGFKKLILGEKINEQASYIAMSYNAKNMKLDNMYFPFTME